jgi:short subunit dehydrogenase-like uncharacterized protein
MNRALTFGIVGGYGATGRVVVSELWKSSEGKILIGGRDLAKGTALAKELGNRVSAALNATPAFRIGTASGKSKNTFEAWGCRPQ